MPRKRATPEPEVTPDTPPCAVNGCGAPGLYKAPQSRTQINAYHFLCIDHIREFNQSWDFFNGMNQDEIEIFMKDAMTGHRPTWKIGTHGFYGRDALEDALAKMLGGKASAKPRAPKADSRDRKALAVLDLEPPVTLKEVKARYKILVKQYHPDVNKGDVKAEERFKRIAVAYKFLSESMKENKNN